MFTKLSGNTHKVLFILFNFVSYSDILIFSDPEIPLVPADLPVKVCSATRHFVPPATPIETLHQIFLACCHSVKAANRGKNLSEQFHRSLLNVGKGDNRRHFKKNLCKILSQIN